jgi:type I restriction enzyme, S subunit
VTQVQANSDLPSGWAETRLGEIAEINPHPISVQNENFEVSFLPMKTVEEITGKFDLGITKKYAEVKKGYTSFVNGDIIFAKITPCMENGKIAVVENLRNGIGFGSTEFHVLRVRTLDISKKFLFYFLTQQAFRRNAKRQMTGSAGQLRVPTRYLEMAPLLLPPSNEQLRIVGKVEELFSFLDTGVASLRGVQAQLKRYRQAVLKHAFEGKLTEQWREMHSQSIIEKQLNNDLPSGWALTRLVDIAEVKMGQSPSGSSCGPNPEGYPLLNGPTEFGPVHPTPRQWTTKPTRICKKGDLLICVRGNTTGRMNWADQEYCIGRGLAALSVSGKDADLFFIYYFLLKEVNEIMRRTTGSTFPNLKSDELKNFELPIAPFEEQKAIVQKIETLLSVAGQTEEDLHTVLVQTNQLRQSILMNAFDGKLVPQVPADEPAERLLERIKTERLTNKSKNNQVELSQYVK